MQLGTLVIISAASASIYLILPRIPPEMPFFTMAEANKVYEETYFSGAKYEKGKEKKEDLQQIFLETALFFYCFFFNKAINS